MINRRRFLVFTGAGAAAVAHKGFTAVSSGADRGFEHGSPLREFGYRQVAFRQGLHPAQLEQTHSVLMNLSDQDLLRPFRLRAGVPAPGCDLGGWYTYEQPSTFGQWISALSRYYAITQDEPTRAKVTRLVTQLGELVEPTGRFYGDSHSAIRFT